MSKEARKLALEVLKINLTLLKKINPYKGQEDLLSDSLDLTSKAITALQEALAKPDFWEGYVPEPVKPAQQEPKIDIYRSFEQWKSGNVLEHGVPRTEHYSEAQLDLVEMGWNYGYDACRAVEQALDKMAENARELGLDYEPAQQEPTCKQDLQVWVQRTGQFSWEPQDERFWTRMQPAHHTEQHLEMVANQSAQQEPVPWSQALENVWAEEPAQQEPVACQYAKDVAMPEYRCVGRCQYDTSPPAQQEPVGKVTETIDGAFKCEFSKSLQKGALLYTTPPAQQEPVACIYKGYLYMAHEFQSGQCPIDSQPLYTSPPAQQEPVGFAVMQLPWVGLTDDVHNAFLQGIRYAANKYEAVSDERFTGSDVSNFLLMEAEELDSSDIARAIEAAHGIKENT